MNLVKEAVDHAGHIGLGALSALPGLTVYGHWHGIFIALWAALLLGVLRELYQMWLSWDEWPGWKRVVDVLFFLPGGAITWLVGFLLF